jgi:cardiolipin synthase
MESEVMAAGFLEDVLPHVLAVLTVLIAILASAHAMLSKRDTLSAVAWVGLIWLVPLIGAALYVLLGINRIKRRAKALKAGQPGYEIPPGTNEAFTARLPEILPEDVRFHALAKLVERVVQKPLLSGNRVTPLSGGEAAYGSMLAAIDAAGETLTLSTYIFDSDRTGGRFVDALSRARDRGVEVRVLIDAVGVRYSWPPVTGALQKAGIRTARFLPPALPWRMPFMNLRNHRKILVADGRVGFTGGMNIRAGHVLGDNPRHPVQDLHFRLEGPVVAHLQEAFAGDWLFSTGERLEGEAWFPRLEAAGEVLARGIPDGPDEDYEKLPLTAQGALACARKSVCIVTPYFLPDPALIASLNLAALRGVEVRVVLPEKNNLPMVKWASTALLDQVLERGCRVLLTPPPFDHSKLMLVDDTWMLFGSGNWDPRSFKLNFEFNVECYDRALAGELKALVDAKVRSARELTLEEVRGRRLPVRLRDGMARLFSPYL